MEEPDEIYGKQVENNREKKKKQSRKQMNSNKQFKHYIKFCAEFVCVCVYVYASVCVLVSIRFVSIPANVKKSHREMFSRFVCVSVCDSNVKMSNFESEYKKRRTK